MIISNRLIATAALVLAVSLGSTPVSVVNAAASKDITCGQLMKMSASQRSRAFRTVAASMPASSLATNLAPSSGGNSSQHRVLRPKNVGQLISACQAASPDSTVRDAYMQSAPVKD